MAVDWAMRIGIMWDDAEPRIVLIVSTAAIRDLGFLLE